MVFSGIGSFQFQLNEHKIARTNRRPHCKASSTRIRIFLFSKNRCPHVVCLNHFRPSTLTRKNDGNTIVCSTGHALHDVWHHLIRKSPFSSVHTKTIVWWRFQKSPLWEAFGKDEFSVTVLTGYVWMVGRLLVHGA